MRARNSGPRLLGRQDYDDRECREPPMNVNAQPSSGSNDPVRPPPPRPPDGRGRHRRRARDLEAQCAVSARRPPRRFLRLHGCDRRHAAICRCWSIRKARRRRPPISVTAWRNSSARTIRCGRRKRKHTPAGSVDAMQKAVDLHAQGRSQAEAHRRPSSASCLMTPRRCCAPHFPMPSGSMRFTCSSASARKNPPKN